MIAIAVTHFKARQSKRRVTVALLFDRQFCVVGLWWGKDFIRLCLCPTLYILISQETEANDQ